MSRGGPVQRGGPLGAEGGNSDDIAFMESLNAIMGDGDLLANLASHGFTLPELSSKRIGSNSCPAHCTVSETYHYLVCETISLSAYFL